ncbi:MAG TPA: flagellar protein FliT [Telluria sp.]|nr:flagellar protein FliT [Telluria sp.]
MNSTEVLSLYESVSDLTGKMVAAARSRDWESLVELESSCASRIAALKAGEPPSLSGETRDRKVRIINTILANDREIRDLTTPWMAELANLINNAGSQRRLTKAYGA